MATRPLGVEAPGVALALRRPGAWTVLGRFCRKKPLGAIGGFLMLVILLTAVFADQLQTHDPIATDAGQSLARPGADHWLGSDHLGRDIYSRIVHGARVSLIVGLASTLMGSVLGGIIGLLSGYIGGKTDLVTQRVMDILQGLPLLVLALVMSAALGPSIPNVVIAISIPIIPRAARVIRASVLSIREMQYVEAARAVGLRHLRIAFRHILPNTIGPFIVL
jgi:peptide/nickel transport system permease protein